MLPAGLILSTRRLKSAGSEVQHELEQAPTVGKYGTRGTSNTLNHIVLVNPQSSGSDRLVGFFFRVHFSNPGDEHTGSGGLGEIAKSEECVSRIAVIGGGLAGLACAAAMAKRGFRVTVLESRQRLGGRAGSFADPATGQMSRCLPARQHGVLHEPRALLRDDRRQALSGCTAAALLRHAGPPAERVQGRPVAGTAPPRPRASRRALPHAGREAARRVGNARARAGEAGRRPAVTRLATRAPADAPHHRPVLGRGAGRARSTRRWTRSG